MKSQVIFDNKEVADQYTKLSHHYDDWFSVQWPEPVHIQGQAIDKICKAHHLPASARVLDLTCGIGTQSIGMALLGHQVTALDISEGQLEKAKFEADKIKPDLPIDWVLGDATVPEEYVSGSYDLIMSFGNSYPLLGTSEAIEASLQSCLTLLNPGGVLLISMRDHTDLCARRPYLMGSGKLNNGDRQGVWVETGDWLEGENRYISHIMFIMTEPQHEEHYFPFPPLAALTKDEFLNMLEQAGYAAPEFFEKAQHPEFSCPLYIATKDTK